MDRTTNRGGDTADLSASSSGAVQSAGASTLRPFEESAHESTLIESAPLLQPHDNDYDFTFEFIDNMEKVKKSRFAHFANKLAVESEPGLTNAQLMCVSFKI